MEPTTLAFEMLNASVNPIGFHLNGEIKVSDLITTLAILISLISLLLALRKDRELREKEQADRVRSAAAKTLAKLERWKEISLLMFDQMDIIFVDVSKLWVENKTGELLRDILWERLDAVKVKALEAIIKEEIETAYQDLFSFDPSVRIYFETVLNLLKDEQSVMFHKALLPGVQNIVDEKEGITNGRTTAGFRNPLMHHAISIKIKYESRLDKLLSVVSENLLELIGKNNEEILYEKQPFFNRLKKFEYSPVVPEYYGIIIKKDMSIIMSKAE
jgi:hypothetical protein